MAGDQMDLEKAQKIKKLWDRCNGCWFNTTKGPAQLLSYYDDNRGLFKFTTKVPCDLVLGRDNVAYVKLTLELQTVLLSLDIIDLSGRVEWNTSG